MVAPLLPYLDVVLSYHSDWSIIIEYYVGDATVSSMTSKRLFSFYPMQCIRCTPASADRAYRP